MLAAEETLPRNAGTYTTLEKRRIAEETQLLRARQSILASALVFVGGSVFGIFLLFEAPPLNVGAWLGTVFVLTAIRGYVCARIRDRVPTATDAELAAHERWFALTSAPLALTMGSSFWIVAAHGTDGAVLTVTLLCCVYAFGSAVNSSVHFPQFLTATLLNLGQGVLFLLLADQTWMRVNALSVGLTGLLLLNFGRSNAATFARSVLIGAQNIELANKRAQEKELVQQALEVASEANLAKSRFLAAASHDLRQPLHALSLFTGTLGLHVQDDEGQRLLTRIEDCTVVLRDQFDALLDVSRFDAGVVVPSISEFDIDVVLERIAHGQREDAARKKLRFALNSCHARVESDPLLIERCITNLVSNAVRYTEEGSVSVDAKLTTGAVQVSVSDTGPGIAEADRESIFDEFVQLHNPARRRREGFGLGLAIVKHIDRLLNLGLGVESTLGVGTVFRLAIPLGHTLSASSAPASSGAADWDLGEGSRQPLVWAFDDDPDVADALSVQLAAWGCRVYIGKAAADVDAGYRQYGRWPDLVLLDDMLGDVESGLDIARMLEASMERERIVFITGNVDLQRQQEIEQAGFTLRRKPVPSRELRYLILSRVSAPTA